MSGANGGSDGLFGTMLRKGIRFESAHRTADEYAALQHIAEQIPDEISESIEVVVADGGHFEVWLTDPLPTWVCSILGGMMNAIILNACGAHNGIGIYGRLHGSAYEVKAQ